MILITSLKKTRIARVTGELNYNYEDVIPETNDDEIEADAPMPKRHVVVRSLDFDDRDLI